MPPDPIADWLLSAGIDPEALVFGIAMGTVSLLGLVLARWMAKGMER